MNKKDQRFIRIWANKIEQGVLLYLVKTTLLACLVSAGTFLILTWGNVPENNYFELILPLSMLTFGLGIPLGLALGTISWITFNNKYKLLTNINDLNIENNGKKQQWHGYDRVWHLAIANIAAIYFILLYTSIFLFDSGNASFLKYSVVGIMLSYFATQIAYAIYRFKIDQQGLTKRFPLAFKYLFSIIMLLTAASWLALIFIEF